MMTTILAKAHYRNFERKKLEEVFCTRFKGKSVLDIGCGQGGNFSILEKANCEINGVDVNAEQVRALQAQGREVYSIDALPDRTYDVLLMSHVIEHMEPDKLVPFMNLYLKRLRPGGKLVVLTPVPGERFWHDSTHVRPYLPQSLWMLIAGLDTAVSSRANHRMKLEDVWFFKDSFRTRKTRAYYHVPGVPDIMKHINFAWNTLMAALYLGTNGRFGVSASWMGIYGND